MGFAHQSPARGPLRGPPEGRGRTHELSNKANRDRWIGEVFQTSRLSAEVKVFLLFLERYYMKPDGRVCEARDDLAKALGCHPRKITAKFNMAMSGGLMEQTVRGGKGRTSTYRAVFPGQPDGSSQSAGTRHSKERTECQHPAPYARAKGAADYHPKQGGQSASTRHSMADPLYKDHARAHSKRGDLDQKTPAPSGTDAPTPDQTDTRVSQSARKREGIRWLGERYGLTEFESAAVIAVVTARAPREIRSFVRYMDGMKEGDLADIVAAIQTRTEEPPEPEREEAPAGGLGLVTEWCGNCDERTRQIELLDGRLKRCPTCHPLRNQETA